MVKEFESGSHWFSTFLKSSEATCRDSADRVVALKLGFNIAVALEQSTDLLQSSVDSCS